MTPFAVVVLAAGAGTRMRSAKHKVLHEAGGVPLLEHVLRAVDPLRPRRVVVVVGHLGDQVRERFAGRAANGDLVFAEQRELLGTGHALWQAEESVLGAFGPGEPGKVLVLVGDAPLLESETLDRMLEAQGDGPGMTLLTATLPDPAGLGRVLRSDDGQLLGIVEHKDASEEERKVSEVNAGFYVFDLGVFARCRSLSADNAQGELYITQLLDIYQAAGLPVRAVAAASPSEVLAANDRVELAAIDRVLRDRSRRAWQAAGVTLIAPETVFLDEGVEIGRDVVLHPGVHLLGSTTVGEGATVGPFAVLKDCRVAPRAQVPAHTVATDATFGIR